MSKVYNIYCDESRHTSDPSDNFMVIGAIGVPRGKKPGIVKDIHRLRYKHHTQGEFGWKRLSPNKRDFYFELIDYFVKNDDLHFRCIIVNKNTFRIENGEMGFYKLYYQMLYHWLDETSEYHIYLDHKVNANQGRLKVLKRCLRSTFTIRALEPSSSKELEIMQLTDLLIGAVGYVRNGRTGSSTKQAFCSELAVRLGRHSIDCPTSKIEPKFNVFNFRGHQ